DPHDKGSVFFGLTIFLVVLERDMHPSNPERQNHMVRALLSALSLSILAASVESATTLNYRANQKSGNFLCRLLNTFTSTA
ncbi:MAG: hypothetical protein NTW91_10260, partial [Verrucomicrobia bacterium]|nr:hypothetical protein [Verrucomicrobiota bacterium]